jgi:hypothetical protein
MPKTTVFKAIRRLKNAKMITDSGNGRYTTFQVQNWHKYQEQGNDSGNAGGTPGEHIQELRSKKNTYKGDEKKIISIYPEVDQILEHYKKVYGVKTIPKRLENIRAARSLLKDYGLDKVLNAIDTAHKASSEDFAPMIGDIIKLKEKYSVLRLWWQRKGKDKGKKMDDEVGEIKSSIGKIIKRG